VLTKDLLRVSRAGGGYHPQFLDRSARPMAARVVGVFQGHVGHERAALDAALADLEPEADHFKIVRGFASLCERDATFETRAEIPPARARRVAFESAETIGGVVTEEDRTQALARAGDRLDTDSEAVANSLYADRDVRQILADFAPRWSPDELVTQYNLSLAQTALYDATEVRVRSSDPRRLVSAVKRLRLMYEVHQTPAGRELVVTGPDALFRPTRRYGTRFARLLRAVAATDDWRLSATIDDRGTERELVLSDSDVSVPGVDPVADAAFDSAVERDFATRFSSLDLDWDLTREPEPLATGTRVMIPDFAFDYRHTDFRVFFEIMGFWTPEYVEKKLSQLENVEDVELLVAVDESLGVGEEIEARDARAIPYRGNVRVKDVVDALGTYEERLAEEVGANLPEELVPDTAVTTIAAVATEYGVPESVVEGRTFPAHERVGRTLVRPDVLDAVADDIEVGMALGEAEAVLAEYDIDDASAVLSRLGYRVEWEGLSGGTVREKQ
jgi:hypothetical protein